MKNGVLFYLGIQKCSIEQEYSCDYLIFGKQTPLISEIFVAFQAGMCKNFKHWGSYSKFKTSMKFV